jgi:hypothetical protein
MKNLILSLFLLSGAASFSQTNYGYNWEGVENSIYCFGADPDNPCPVSVYKLEGIKWISFRTDSMQLFNCITKTTLTSSYSILSLNGDGWITKTPISSFTLPFTQITSRPLYYHNNGAVSVPKEFTDTAMTASGNAVFHLTVDGSPTGTAIFTNANYFKAEVSDADNLYRYSYSLSPDKKTLTVTVKTGEISVGDLVFNSAVNGTPVYIYVKGN